MTWININDITYPIGSTFETSDSTSPAETLGGVWSLVSSGPKRSCIGSTVLHPGTSGTGQVSSYTSLIGAYNTGLIDGIFDNVTIPSGWHREYRLAFQGYSGNSLYITMALNNIETSSISTWSGNTFRIIGASDFFKESDIILETTYQYSTSGINLKYKVVGTSASWQIWNVTLSGFLTTDKTFYTWERVE